MSSSDSPPSAGSTQLGDYGHSETRERILQAAWDEMLSDTAGFALVAVAKRASVSRQSIYLHFSDRAGLLTALIQHVNQQINLNLQLEAVKRAPSGVDALKLTVQVAANIAPDLDPIIRAFEVAQYTDPAIAKAQRMTKKGRRSHHQMVIERLREESQLSDDWGIEEAADFFFSMTMPGMWRELVVDLGWTTDAYVKRLTQSLIVSLVDTQADRGTRRLDWQPG